MSDAAQRSNSIFFTFLLCGSLDLLSTAILITRKGLSVEANPLVRLGFTELGLYYCFPHLLLVCLAAHALSQPSWGELMRMKIRKFLFYIYLFVVTGNWYQVILGL